MRWSQVGQVSEMQQWPCFCLLLCLTLRPQYVEDSKKGLFGEWQSRQRHFDKVELSAGKE
jgi:hypothetical protein